ncbi:hypothetical protein EDB92DRAFT_1849522 [Lactarius akahatsu]|uniref:Uncharacterized protein n=1 Tax=Lactarius akahatsu TaxID=416441 RepID=A0AAD4LJ14_9AGAM|nr:hypothetical protein EDB92DRAFT_1849522 [Lactarius akahatsu]
MVHHSSNGLLFTTRLLARAKVSALSRIREARALKVVFITVPNATFNSWAAEVKHFSRLPQYTILVFNHRGTGKSGTPMGPYSSVPSLQ